MDLRQLFNRGQYSIASAFSPVYLVLALSLMALASCTSGESDTPPSENVNAAAATLDSLMASYQEERLKLFPLDATYLGDDRYDDQLRNSLTVAFEDSLRTFYTRYRYALAAIDRGTLDATDAVSYDVLSWETDIALESLDFDNELLPLDQFNGFHLGIGQLASGAGAQPFRSPEDYQRWLRRVDQFVVMLDTAEANMRRGVARGAVLPEALSRKLLPQLEEMATAPLVEHLYYGPIVRMGDTLFNEDTRAELARDYEAMVEQKVRPAFRGLSAYVRNEYIPASRKTSGIGSLPNGDAYYDHLVRRYTTTDMSAEEIFDLGESEVSRLSSEMEAVKASVGFDGSLREFFDHVRERRELMPFNDPQQVIDNFNAIYSRMKPQLSRLFNNTPKTPFEVRRTEAFREASASAEYNPGSLDGTRPGIFYVPIPDVAAYNMFSDEDLFLHEAIPGHHYQISLTQENTALPDFRRSLWYSAYGEGWALYTESLGRELGLYTDPYQYFGMLSAEMHRAIRLVVDVGLHRKGWTREQAIQYSLEHEAESEASIVAEIERYMAIPGQALSYKVGQLKIRELRARAEQVQGENFDIAAFHDLVLEGGCLPLAVLERKVDAWLNDSKPAQTPQG